MLLLALPDIPEQIRALAELLGMSEAEWHWWNYLGVGLGLIVMFASVYPAWRRLAGFVLGGGITLKGPPLREVIWPLLGLIGLLMILAGIIVGVVHLLTMERPSFVWTHPYEPAWEHEKDKAECEMLALEKIGTGDWVTTASGRERYMNACMTRKGYKLKEVQR